MSKMAEEAYLQDKYGQQDYVDYLEDKIGVMIENEIKIKKQIGAKKYEEINKVLERNANSKFIVMGSSKRK